MTDPLKYLKIKIKEIEEQLIICKENESDVTEVQLYLIEYKYAYQLLRDFGMVITPEERKSELHYGRKLTADDVRYIRKFFNPNTGKYSKHSTIGLAKKFGIKRSTVYSILNHTIWKNVA